MAQTPAGIYFPSRTDPVAGKNPGDKTDLQLMAESIPAEIVDSLPAQSEGLEILFQTALMKAAKIAWLCRCVPTLPGAAKWLVLSGGPLIYSLTNTYAQTGTSSSPATVNLAVTVPIDMVANVEHEVAIDNGGGGPSPALLNASLYQGSFAVGGAEATYLEAGVATPAGGAPPGLTGDGRRSAPRVGLSAGVLEQRITATPGPTRVRYRTMTVSPVALGGLT